MFSIGVAQLANQGGRLCMNRIPGEGGDPWLVFHVALPLERRNTVFAEATTFLWAPAARSGPFFCGKPGKGDER
jgi:hypothetical protein